MEDRPPSPGKASEDDNVEDEAQRQRSRSPPLDGEGDDDNPPRRPPAGGVPLALAIAHAAELGDINRLNQGVLDAIPEVEGDDEIVDDADDVMADAHSEGEDMDESGASAAAELDLVWEVDYNGGVADGVVDDIDEWHACMPHGNNLLLINQLQAAGEKLPDEGDEPEELVGDGGLPDEHEEDEAALEDAIGAWFDANGDYFEDEYEADDDENEGAGGLFTGSFFCSPPGRMDTCPHHGHYPFRHDTCMHFYSIEEAAADQGLNFLYTVSIANIKALVIIGICICA